ncbi:MAG: hypothetical protein ACLVFG_04625 [Lachnospiraceae bacterium]
MKRKRNGTIVRKEKSIMKKRVTKIMYVTPMPDGVGSTATFGAQ